MTRMYIQPSFVDSCSDHGEWSGGNGQYRGDRSVEVVPTYINGRPNVRAFSDEAIEARRAKKKTSVPLKQRILPQASRVDKLRSEAIELELAFKAGEFTAEEYTLLRDVQFKKLRRAEELLKKAITPVQKEEETDEDGVEMYVPIHDMAQDDDGCKDEPFAWLSDRNSLKKILQNTCKVVNSVVNFSQKAKSYWNELKEL